MSDLERSDKSVLVIGNGFDLDLGFKTRFSDFANSTKWKKLHDMDMAKKSGLSIFLQKAAKTDYWFDLEANMMEYVNQKRGTDLHIEARIDQLYLKFLKEKLFEYLADATIWESYDEESLAKRMLNNAEYYDRIYSFNYTDYYLKSYYVHSVLGNIIYVHNKDNPIVGIGEDDCQIIEYAFLKKMNQEGYPSTNLIFDLIDADEVVFFGHSFNKIDMLYFEKFLKACLEIGPRNRKLIIISKDQHSLERIKENISNIGVKITELSSICDVDFVPIDDYYDGKYEVRSKVSHLI